MVAPGPVLAASHLNDLLPRLKGNPWPSRKVSAGAGNREGVPLVLVDVGAAQVQVLSLLEDEVVLVDRAELRQWYVRVQLLAASSSLHSSLT